MSLPNIILTVLSTSESTGYDITKEISYFWKACHQQIYRQLNKMANDNLVTCRLKPQEGKPDRKVYSITELGRITLLDWFQQPACNPAMRDEISAKLLVCGILNSEPMQQRIEAIIEKLQVKLKYRLELEHTQFPNYK